MCAIEFDEAVIRVPPAWGSHPGLVRGPAGVQRSPAWHDSRQATLGAGGFAIPLGTYAQAREATAAAVVAVTAAALDPAFAARADVAVAEALRLDTTYDVKAGVSATADIRRLARAWGEQVRDKAPPTRPDLAGWHMSDEHLPPRADPAAFYGRSPAAAKGVVTESLAAAIAQALLRHATGTPLDVLPGEVFRASRPLPPYVQVSLDAAVGTLYGGGFPVELKSLATPWVGAPPRVPDAYVLQCLLQAMVMDAPAGLLVLTYVHAPRAAIAVMTDAGVDPLVVAATQTIEACRAEAWERELEREPAPVPDVRPHCGAVFTVTRTRESDRLLTDWAVGMGILAANAAGFPYCPGQAVALDTRAPPGPPVSHAGTFAAYVAWKADIAWDARVSKVMKSCIAPGLSPEVGALLANVAVCELPREGGTASGATSM